MLPKIRQPLALHALCAVGGIVAADQWPWVNFRLWPWAAALGALLWLAWAWPLRRLRTGRWCAGAAATFCLFFAWHGYLLTDGPGAALAAQVPAEGRVAKVVGVVDNEPEVNKLIRLRLETLGFDENSATPSHAQVLVRWKNGGPLRYGDRVEIAGDLHRIPPVRNPGVFDGPEYWRSQGITCELRVRYGNDVRVLESGCGRPFVARAIALRHWLEGVLTLDLEDSPEIAALIRSMVLGVQGDSMEETRELFQYTGTMHLFAVSGMNVAMLFEIVTVLLLTAGVSRRAAAVAAVPLLWAFCYATGLTPSSLRATVMATIYCGGLLTNRFALSWNMLGASALALLAWNPGTLFTSGFQLSFLMVAFLLLFSPAIRRWCADLTKSDPLIPPPLYTGWLRARTSVAKGLTEAVVVSGIAWIGSTPLMIRYFHLWSPSTVPANIVAAFLTWLMLVLGLASVAAGLVWRGAAVVFNNANWLVAKGLLGFVSSMASLPYSHLFVESPPWKTAAYCTVEVLDIPGGAATHLRIEPHPLPRRDWLIDCGGAAAETYTVSPYLRSQGVNRLDGLLLTHGDTQHIGGAARLLLELPVEEVVDSPLRDRSPSRKALHAALERTGRGKALVCRGDALTLAPGVKLTVLFPPETLEASRADDKALVLRLDACGRRFLFSSDAGFRTESWLLENAPPEELRCDAWIKQAHAGDLSGTPEFLEAVRPALIVASGAAFPPEERINEEWARDVENRHIRLLRQDRAGAVRITLDPRGNWEARPFLSGTE